MTQAEKYTVTYLRCDDCGCNIQSDGTCGQCSNGGFAVECKYLDCTADCTDVASKKTDNHGTTTTFNDGSTYYQSNSGW